MYIWQYFICIYTAFFSPKALPRMFCRPACAPRTMDEVPQYYLPLWSLNLTFLSNKMDPTLQSSILSLICVVTIYLCLVWTWGRIWKNFWEFLSLLFWQQWLTTHQHTYITVTADEAKYYFKRILTSIEHLLAKLTWCTKDVRMALGTDYKFTLRTESIKSPLTLFWWYQFWYQSTAWQLSSLDCGRIVPS